MGQIDMGMDKTRLEHFIRRNEEKMVLGKTGANV